MFAAGIIIFNDADSLRRCLESIHNDVDLIFVIDGRFAQFPGNSNLSTDGSRELVKSYSKCLLIDFPESEPEKRNKYLELCKEYSVDMLLIIDSDEYILESSDWFEFRRNVKKIIFDRDNGAYNVYSIMLQSLDKSSFLPYPRLWYKRIEMTYHDGRHYYFRNKNIRRHTIPHQGNHAPNLIKGLRIGHNHILRSIHHMESRLIYQTWLVKFESSLPSSNSYNSSSIHSTKQAIGKIIGRFRKSKESL